MVQSLNDGSSGSKICFVAADIKEKTRQSAFLLYYAEEEVCDIFETLPQNGDDFETAKEKLTEYFDHKKNVGNFRQSKQNHSELIWPTKENSPTGGR